MDNPLLGKVALITGGSFGIGRATAISFAALGATVVIADLLDNNVNSALSQILAEGGNGIFVKCDVSKSDQVASLIQTILLRYGRLDFAFNNAGVEGLQACTHKYTEEEWDRVLSVNLKGIWLCMKHEIPVMPNTGAIVNCASVAGLRGFADMSAYVASKHGVIGLTKTAALENAVRGLRINVVCPGVIHTSMIDRLTGLQQDVEQQYIDLEPLGRMGTPEEIAEVVTFLCLPGASYITGSVFTADGGLTAG